MTFKYITIQSEFLFVVLSVFKLYCTVLWSGHFSWQRHSNVVVYDDDDDDQSGISADSGHPIPIQDSIVHNAKLRR